MWVPSGEKSGSNSPAEPRVTGIASAPAVCCTQICIMPPPPPDTYASSLPSRESLGQQYAAEVICLVSADVGFFHGFHNRRAATPIAKSTPAAVSMAMVGIGNLWDLA